MAKVKRIIGGKVRDFDPTKHPRGHKGRFVDTPDPVSPTREIKRQSRVLRETKKAADVYQARLELHQSLNREQRKRLQVLSALNPEQRQRLGEILKRKKAQPQVVLGSSETKPATTQALQKNPDKPKKTKQAISSDRLSANPEHLTIKGNRLSIWEGKPELGKAQGGFKTKRVRDFEYSVEVDGKKVTLNRNTNMHEYMGERVYGMPSLNPRLASMTPTQLADGLAKYMTKVETKDSTVPDWLPTFHGKVDKSLLKNGYGKMQQHHIYQWAKVPLENIVKDYESGKITLEEAKAQTKDILSRETIKTKSGKEKEDWVLTPADRDKRSFVVLPGGLHDISNKPMYWANHPMGIDVDAPDFKLRPYRLPKHGDSGRDWHSSVFRPGSWLEIYRRESYVLLGELNRRIKKGELTSQEAQSLFTEGLAKVDRANQYRLKYSNSQEG